jgi:methylenetetrahydrofolate dehydrogenase (NADP+) / methenyltetrahydrofolate cyclohydrolase
VLVGDRPDSAAYVVSKGKACQNLGMGSFSHHLPVDATQEQVEKLVRSLQHDKKVHIEDPSVALLGGQGLTM